MEVLINTLDEADLTDRQQDMLFKSWCSLNEGYSAMRDVMTAADNGSPLDNVSFFPTVEQALSTFKPLLRLTIKLPDLEKFLESKKLGVCLHELLTNVLKHSPEKTAHVVMDDDGEQIRMIVVSSGEASAPKKGNLGLSHMATRLKSWGGHLHTRTHEGTYRAEVTLPLKNI